MCPVVEKCIKLAFLKALAAATAQEERQARAELRQDTDDEQELSQRPKCVISPCTSNQTRLSSFPAPLLLPPLLAFALVLPGSPSLIASPTPHSGSPIFICLPHRRCFAVECTRLCCMQLFPAPFPLVGHVARPRNVSPRFTSPPLQPANPPSSFLQPWRRGAAATSWRGRTL